MISTYFMAADLSFIVYVLDQKLYGDWENTIFLIEDFSFIFFGENFGTILH